MPRERFDFNGVDLPPGADESWWGAIVPKGSPDEEDKRQLHVPANRKSDKQSAHATNTANPGDTVWKLAGETEDDDLWGVERALPHENLPTPEPVEEAPPSN